MANVDPPKLPKKIIPALAVEQVTALLASSGKDFYGVRDRAILLLLLDTDLRAAELLSLTVAQVDTRAGGKLVVMGKGAKQREVFFGPTTATALKDYVRRHGTTAGLPAHATLAMTERYLTLTGEDLAAAHKQHSPADLLPAAATTSGRKRLR